VVGRSIHTLSQDTIDTASPGGRHVLYVFAALAEFERDLIKERSNAGLAAAPVQGSSGSRQSQLPKSSI
jgi:DNA invertase Pin-like site-specific DNA recombinase